jgi:hypothetical protein
MGADIRLPLLETARIASPCDARWEDMVGDDRTRRCAQCELDVHNIARLMRAEAEALLDRSLEGRVCARIYRRADGTIITRDCPVGVAALRRRARAALARVGALLGLTCGAGVVGAAMTQEGGGGWGAAVRLRMREPFSRVCEWLDPTPAPAVAGRMVMMGEFMPMPPTAPAPTTPGGNTPPSQDGPEECGR